MTIDHEVAFKRRGSGTTNRTTRFFVNRSLPASTINRELTGTLWSINKDGKEVYFSEDLGFVVSPLGFPLGLNVASGLRPNPELRLVGIDDGRGTVGPSFASLTRGHAEAVLAYKQRHAAAMASAVRQLGQTSASLAATMGQSGPDLGSTWRAELRQTAHADLASRRSGTRRAYRPQAPSLRRTSSSRPSSSGVSTAHRVRRKLLSAK